MGCQDARVLYPCWGGWGSAPPANTAPPPPHRVSAPWGLGGGVRDPTPSRPNAENVSRPVGCVSGPAFRQQSGTNVATILGATLPGRRRSPALPEARSSDSQFHRRSTACRMRAVNLQH
jgi:hypothetical protein